MVVVYLSEPQLVNYLMGHECEGRLMGSSEGSAQVLVPREQVSLVKDKFGPLHMTKVIIAPAPK